MRFYSAVLALALVFGAAQCGYAGILTSKVTFSGEAMLRDEGSSQSWYTDGQNSVAYYHVTGTQNDWYTFMQVALPAISGTILSATLNIDVTSGYWNFNGNAALGAADLYHASNSSSATGHATQGIVADQFVQNISSPPDGWLTLTVTDFIKADYVSGYGYTAFTFAPVGSGEGNSALGFEAGKNTSDQQLNEFAPYLSITTRSDSGQVPEPGTLLMVALGSAGLLAYRRTRRP